MDVALSPNGRRAMRVFFALVIVFLYAPFAILLVFSFNSSPVPVFPLSGFTLRWYHDFLTNADIRGALGTSAIIAAVSSVGAVVLGILAAIGLTRRHFRGQLGVTALLLSPLVIPLLVLGVSLALLFHELGMQRSMYTVMIGHIVITVPYTILVIRPRLGQIDASLGEAAYDLGAGPLTTFRRVTLPLILPAVVSAFMIAFTTSFDEYAVASFLVGPRQTFPVYLYAALRFPSQLPQVIAVAVVVLMVSLVVIVAAEIGRRRAEARLEAPA
jgi:spermidine/putrescine transport system permease protein